MKTNYLLLALALAATLGLSAPAQAAEAKKSTSDAASSADNTKQNKQHAQELTADQQAETPADRKITQQVRQAIVKDKSLSSYAHNVKIITRAGAVTLKGPVRSEKEKQAVEKAAVEVAGKGNVKNELDIAHKKEKKSEKKSDKSEKKQEK